MPALQARHALIQAFGEADALADCLHNVAAAVKSAYPDGRRTACGSIRKSTST